MDLKNSSLQLAYIYHVERVGIILMRFGKNTSTSRVHFLSDIFVAVAVAALLRKLFNIPGVLALPVTVLNSHLQRYKE